MQNDLVTQTHLKNELVICQSHELCLIKNQIKSPQMLDPSNNN